MDRGLGLLRVNPMPADFIINCRSCLDPGQICSLTALLKSPLYITGESVPLI